MSASSSVWVTIFDEREMIHALVATWIDFQLTELHLKKRSIIQEINLRTKTYLLPQNVSKIVHDTRFTIKIEEN